MSEKEKEKASEEIIEPSNDTNKLKDVIPEKVKHPSTWITAGLVVCLLYTSPSPRDS